MARMVSDARIKVLGFRPYSFRDDKTGKTVSGVSLHYKEYPTEEDLKNGFIGDKVGVCSLPGSRSDISIGVEGRLVYELRVWQGEQKLRVVDFVCD